MLVFRDSAPLMAKRRSAPPTDPRHAAGCFPRAWPRRPSAPARLYASARARRWPPAAGICCLACPCTGCATGARRFPLYIDHAQGAVRGCGWPLRLHRLLIWATLARCLATRARASGRHHYERRRAATAVRCPAPTPTRWAHIWPSALASLVWRQSPPRPPTPTAFYCCAGR